MDLASTSSAVGVISRLLALLRRKPGKRLEATVLGRGIVAEVPFDEPYRLVDLEGRELDAGVYVLVLRLWNRGGLPIFASDIPPSAPLQIALDPGVRVIAVRTISTVKSFVCDVTADSSNVYRLEPEGFSPGDDMNIAIYYSGNQINPDVKVHGRIIGQSTAIDLTHLEHRASVGERVACLLLLVWIIGSLPALLVSGFLIWHDYGWHSFLDMRHLPHVLSSSFAFGLTFLAFALMTTCFRWLERRRQPRGYPLDTDLDPPVWSTIWSMIKTVATGRKIRISASLFSLGQPLPMTRKKPDKRSPRDWIG